MSTAGSTAIYFSCLLLCISLCAADLSSIEEILASMEDETPFSLDSNQTAVNTTALADSITTVPAAPTAPTAVYDTATTDTPVAETVPAAPATTSPPTTSLPTRYSEIEAYLLRTMDLAKDPCGDSFYDYACGNFGIEVSGFEDAYDYVQEINLKMLDDELGGEERKDDVEFSLDSVL